MNERARRKRRAIALSERTDTGGCGLYTINVLLMMLRKKKISFPFSPEKGISSWKMLRELRKAGLDVKSKTISIRNLKPESILWYPEDGWDGGHYVVVGEIENGRALVYDVEKKEPEWLSLSILRKNWYRWYHNRWCGWVIEVKQPNGRS